MAARGNPRRAFWLLVVGVAIAAGGAGAFVGVRHEFGERIAERQEAEAHAALTGTEVPDGPSSQTLRREADVIPYLMLVVVGGGFLLIVLGVAEYRGWKAWSPVFDEKAAQHRKESGRS